MSRNLRMTLAGAGSRIAAVPLAALALIGCAASTPQSHASAAQQAACRQQADQTFQVRNPDANYAADAYVSGTRDTPFSGSGMAANTSSGLPARYSRDTLYSNCVNGVGPPLGAAATTTPTTTTPGTTTPGTTTPAPPQPMPKPTP